MRAIGSHQSARPKSEIWLTPPFVLEALGAFDLDPCAADPRPWDTARCHFTKTDDGLSREWLGRVWLNPPYSSAALARWLARMAAHDHGTALIFARTETETFFRHVWEGASGLLFLERRLHFHVAADTWFPRKDRDGNEIEPIFVPAGGRAPANAGAPSVLCAYGPADCERLAASHLDGAFVPLRLVGLVRIADPMKPGTWAQEIEAVMAELDRPVPLSDLYRAFARNRKTAGNPNWRAKIRQQLQRGPYRRASRGVWEREERSANA